MSDIRKLNLTSGIQIVVTIQVQFSNSMKGEINLTFYVLFIYTRFGDGSDDSVDFCSSWDLNCPETLCFTWI